MTGSWGDQDGWGQGGPTSWDDRPDRQTSGPATGAGTTWDPLSAASGVHDVPTDTGPPVLPLTIAAVCAVLAAVGAILSSGRPVVAVVSWVLAGFVCVGLLSLHAQQDARRRTNPWYVPRTWATVGSVAVAVVAVVVVVVSALAFALHVGRL